MSCTVYFDSETGGLTPKHPTIQLAAIAVRDWAEVDTFEAKLRFDESAADPEALAMNHYDADLWSREAVPERAALEEFAAWLKPYRSLTKVSKRTGRPYSVARLAGHNIARFDAPRLVDAFKRHGIFLPADSYRPLDTLQRALWYFAEESEPEPEDYKLGTLAKFFGISTEGAHDALQDVRITVRLAARICTDGPVTFSDGEVGAAR